jgi:tetrahydromethanopterin S-methyltransferase subunit C
LLLISLFLDWVGPSGRSGWSSLGWLTLLVCVAAIAVAAWLVAATALARPLAQMVAACVLTAVVGTLTFVVVLVRIAIVQPGPNAVTTIEAGAYVGLAAALLIAAAGWWAIKDERTDAPESAYTPPAPRPAPPARSS